MNTTTMNTTTILMEMNTEWNFTKTTTINVITTQSSTTTTTLTLTQILTGIAQIILGFIIIFGNTLTVAAIRKFRRLKTETGILIASLAIADLFMGFTMWLHACYEFVPQMGWSNFMCSFKYFTFFLSSAASIYNLILIAVDRYIAITQPLRYHQWITYRTVPIMMIITWMWCVMIAMVPFFWYNTRSNPKQLCTFFHHIPKYFLACVLGTQHFICMIAMIVLYGQILIVALKQQRQIQAESITTPANNNPTNASKSKPKISFSKQLKTAKLFAVVIGLFLFCWTPVFVLLFLHASNVYSSRSIAYTIAPLLGVVNSCVNPIIYSWKNKDYKLAFKKLLCLSKETIGLDESLFSEHIKTISS
ncbi:unnamed protein product [Owenia fusiformis]|uniref:Uncharacterized protein n=1 Tax=Owenia fusiformis TaxID=6347 RepID=A0A8J1YBU2_OWEFU|nr:unnamed protein product [Owenia fusiformis]